MLRHSAFFVVTVFSIVTSVACGDSNARSSKAAGATAANPPAADQRAGQVPRPIALSGCLQQDGRTYIVTHLNEPSREGIGTTGNAAAVEREQLREAANAYRLESKNQSDWDTMIGKQVRVSGSLDKAADLPTPAGAANGTDGSGGASASAAAGVGTAGSSETGTREKIGKGDLARIAVDSMTVVAENCGGGDTSASSSKASPAGSGTRR